MSTIVPTAASARSEPSCLSHPDRPPAGTCSQCAEPFCVECLATAGGVDVVCPTCRLGLASTGAGVAGAGADAAWDVTPRPWRRYFARSFDYLVAAVLFSAALGVLLELSGVEIETVPDFLWGVVIVGLWAPCEGVLLSLWGTTPGKALLATRVRTKTGEEPTFGTGIQRSFSVWFRGMGLGLGIIQLIANIVAYRTLSSEKETSWDSAYELRVEHRPLGILRVVTFVAIFVGGCLLLLWAASLEA